MNPLHSLINAILVIVCIYGLAVLLRRKGALTEDHALALARIVTDLCLPAMIFVSLAGRTIHPHELGPSGVMMGLLLCCIPLAWWISARLKFSRAQQGAIVFCSAFGSSTFLGYALVLQVFPDSHEALTEAVLISEIGVGYPIFILGPVLAAWFSSSEVSAAAQWKRSLMFFKSPVFYALVVSLAWGPLGLPGDDHVMLAPVFQLGRTLASALTPIAILSVGLVFRIPRFRSIMIALAIVVTIKLILQPLMAALFSDLFGFPELWKDVLVLLSAMPPAILGAVFLKRYGGDASLASALLLAASLLSIGTLIGVFWLVA